MRPVALWLVFTLLTLVAQSSRAETVHLTSLEWPPYSGADLPENGASIAVARAAFEAMGHQLDVDFFPWSRTIATARQEARYVGYIPEYFLESDAFSVSGSIGDSPLGLVESTARPIEWRTVADLRGYRLGVVQDYINTPELDGAIARGEIEAHPVLTDTQNILKVAAGRVDAAVIDRYVLDYLTLHNPWAAEVKDQVRMNPQLLARRTLHIAFETTPAGQRWQRVFNQGIEKIDVNAIIQRYFERYLNQPPPQPSDRAGTGPSD